MEIKRILMPTDFSTCADAALDHALFLARRYRAELHLLHAVVLHEEDVGPIDDAFPSMEELFERIEAAARSGLGRLLERQQGEIVRVEEVIRRGVAAAPTITDYIEEKAIDLVVIGTHGRRGLRHFLLGSVAEEIVRTASCPVVTIRDQEGGRRLERPERLLVPFDFSPAAESALKAGLQLAKEYDARLDLLHVISPPIDVTGYGLTMPSSPYLEVTGELTKVLDQRLAAIDPNIQVRSHVQHGSSGSEIIRFAAEKDSDLIVIGSHGLRGMTRWLLGSVAEKVIRGAECPVLVLRDGGKEASAAEEASSDAASDET